MKILVINPGSTSTKISIYEDRQELHCESVFHEASQLMVYPKVNQQLSFRLSVLETLLNKWAIGFDQIDAIAARGGSAYSQKPGVIVIDQKLFEDTRDAVNGGEHPSKLGVMMAYTLSEQYHIPAYTMDSINSDEFCDYARITGIKGVYRKPQAHVLNQKAVGRYYGEQSGKGYEQCNLIIAHIDGGVTVTAHQRGRMIDSNIGSSGDGPFTPTRIGSVPVSALLDYLKTHDLEETRNMCSRSGGFVSYFGSSDGEKVHQLVLQGDEKAALIWNAMIYNIAKEIGAMAAVLHGNVDAILLTGGYIRFEDLVNSINDYCGFIAPITCIKDREQQTLAEEVDEVLCGRKEAFRYTGKPVFDGFECLK